MKILVIGNCQQIPIASILRTSGFDAVTPSVALYQLNAGHREELDNLIGEADRVLLQNNFGENFVNLGVSPDAMRAVHNDVTLFPNLYFSGFHPSYISVRSEHNILFSDLIIENKLGPHLDLFALVALDHNIQYEELLASLGSYFPKESDELYRSITKESKDRESQCDVRIFDWIEEKAKQESIFYSFNHPDNSVFSELVARYLARIGSDSEVTCRLKPYLSNYRLPIYPIVASLLNVKGDPEYPLGGGAADHDMNVHVGKYDHLANTYEFMKRLLSSDSTSSALGLYRNTAAYRGAERILLVSLKLRAVT